MLNRPQDQVTIKPKSSLVPLLQWSSLNHIHNFLYFLYFNLLYKLMLGYYRHQSQHYFFEFCFNKLMASVAELPDVPVFHTD